MATLIVTWFKKKKESLKHDGNIFALAPPQTLFQKNSIKDTPICKGKKPVNKV